MTPSSTQASDDTLQAFLIDVSSLPSYGEDIGAAATDAILHLSPQSPSINAFAFKQMAKHNQLLNGNAFYRAHWTEQHGFSQNKAQTLARLGIREDDASDDTHGTDCRMDVSRPTTPVATHKRLQAAQQSELHATSLPSHIMTNVGTMDDERFTAQLTPGMSVAPRVPSPLTATHPALRDKPRDRPNIAPDTPESQATPSHATVHSTSRLCIPDPMERTPYYPDQVTGAVTRASPSSDAATRHNASYAGLAIEQPHVPRSTEVLGHIVDTPEGLHARKKISYRANPSTTEQNGDDGAATSTADRGPSAHFVACMRPSLASHRTAMARLESPHERVMLDRVPPLKLMPSPLVARNARPTERAMIEKRKDQNIQKTTPDIDESPVLHTQIYTPKFKNVTFEPKSPAPRESPVHSKSPKKLTFIEKIRFARRTTSQATRSTSPLPSANMASSSGNDVSSAGILNAQPKAQAVLIGTTLPSSVDRTPSKKKIFSRKTSEENEVPKSPRKRLSFGFMDNLLESPRKTKPHRMPDRALNRSQSLKYLDNIVPPTPPTKDTPPDVKTSKAARTLGLGVSYRSQYHEASLVETQSPLDPPRFGTLAHLQTPRLVTQPSSHSLHASVIPELMDSEDFAEVKAKIDGLDLQGFSLPHESRIAATSPMMYSPSMYSSTGRSPFLNRVPSSLPIRKTGRLNTPNAQTGWSRPMTPTNTPRIGMAEHAHGEAPLLPQLPRHTQGPGQQASSFLATQTKGRSASIGTVTIHYPDLPQDPSFTTLQDNTGSSQVVKKAWRGSNVLTEHIDSPNLASTVQTAAQQTQFLASTVYTPPNKKNNITTKILAARSESPRLVLKTEDVGRGAMPDYEDAETLHSADSEPPNSAELDKVMKMLPVSDTPRSMHPELLPLPLRRQPSDLPSLSAEPRTPSRMGRRRQGKDLKIITNAPRAHEIVQGSSSSDYEPDRNTHRIPVQRRDSPREDTSAPLSKLDEILRLIEDRDHQIRAMLKDAFPDTSSVAEIERPSTATSNRSIDKPGKLEPFKVRTEQSMHPICEAGIVVGAGRDQQPILRTSPAVAAKKATSQMWPHRSTDTGKASPSTPSKDISRPPVSPSRPAFALEVTSPALESSPDILKGRPRTVRQAGQAATHRSRHPAKLPASASSIALKESLAKNRDYEHTIQELLKRLAQVEGVKDENLAGSV